MAEDDLSKELLEDMNDETAEELVDILCRLFDEPKTIEKTISKERKSWDYIEKQEKILDSGKDKHWPWKRQLPEWYFNESKSLKEYRLLKKDKKILFSITEYVNGNVEFDFSNEVSIEKAVKFLATLSNRTDAEKYVDILNNNYLYKISSGIYNGWSLSTKSSRIWDFSLEEENQRKL